MFRVFDNVDNWKSYFDELAEMVTKLLMRVRGKYLG